MKILAKHEGDIEETDDNEVFRYGRENLPSNNVSKEEIRQYYDIFYAEAEFDHYDEQISRSFLKALFKKALVPPGAAVLDVGCATGFYTEQFRRMGYAAVGLDISRVGILKGKSKYPSLQLLVGDAAGMPFKPASFDVLFMSGCSLANTGDLRSIQKFLERLTEYVTDKGVLIFVGGSNLTGQVSVHSEWIYHRYSEILNFVDPKAVEVEGPYITAARIASMLGSLSLTKTFSMFVRLLHGTKTWSVIYFLRRKGAVRREASLRRRRAAFIAGNCIPDANRIVEQR